MIREQRCSVGIRGEGQERPRFSAISGNKRGVSRGCRRNVSRDHRDRGRNRSYFYYHWLFTVVEVLRSIVWVREHTHTHTHAPIYVHTYTYTYSYTRVQGFTSTGCGRHSIGWVRDEDWGEKIRRIGPHGGGEGKGAEEHRLSDYCARARLLPPPFAVVTAAALVAGRRVRTTAAARAPFAAISCSGRALRVARANTARRFFSVAVAAVVVSITRRFFVVPQQYQYNTHSSPVPGAAGARVSRTFDDIALPLFLPLSLARHHLSYPHILLAVQLFSSAAGPWIAATLPSSSSSSSYDIQTELRTPKVRGIVRTGTVFDFSSSRPQPRNGRKTPNCSLRYG